MISKINIIGSGNVAHHLAMSLIKTDVLLYCRDLKSIEPTLRNSGIQIVEGLDVLRDADLTILAVSDDALLSVSKKINSSQAVVHTSGSVHMEVLKQFGNYGILYPLQTFSKKDELDINEVPFLLEASDEKFEKALLSFCSKQLSGLVSVVNSEQREKIHLAAVVVNNFVNQLFFEAQEILKQEHLDWTLLKPLIHETIRKAEDIGPKAAQTGPAKRNDKKIIDKHLSLIDDPKIKEIYRLISERIRETNS